MEDEDPRTRLMRVMMQSQKFSEQLETAADKARLIAQIIIRSVKNRHKEANRISGLIAFIFQGFLISRV